MESDRATDTELPALEHYREFRNRLMICATAMPFAFLLGYAVFPSFSALLMQPLQSGALPEPVALTLTEPFLARLKYSLVLAVLFLSPLILYHLAAFFLPALKPGEKRILSLLLGVGLLLFLAGVFYAREWILPLVASFLEGAREELGIRQELKYSDTLGFVFQFMLAFGLMFQFPILLAILLFTGIVSRKALLDKSRWVIMTCALFSALLTPPDPASMLLLLLPMVVLYYGTLGLAGLFGVK